MRSVVSAAGPPPCERGERIASANPARPRYTRGIKSVGCLINPPDDSRRVEDVTRDADAAQSLLDIAPDGQASDHHGSVADQSGQ
jgi:hypothetical protein